MISLEHKIPPPLVGILVAAAMGWLAGWGPQLSFPAAPQYAVIAFLILAGGTFDVMASWPFAPVALPSTPSSRNGHQRWSQAGSTG